MGVSLQHSDHKHAPTADFELLHLTYISLPCPNVLY